MGSACVNLLLPALCSHVNLDVRTSLLTVVLLLLLFVPAVLIFQLPVLLPNKYMYCLTSKKNVERKGKILLLK